MKNLIYSTFLLITTAVSTSAQDQVLTFMRGVPQSKNINPAFAPKKGGYVSMPIIGSLQIGAGNSGFAWSDVVRKGTGAQADSLIIDLDRLSSRIGKENIFNVNSHIHLFGVGINTKAGFFSLDVNTRITGNVLYPGSILDLRYGNWNYEQQKPISHSLSDIFASSQLYSEIGLGYARQLTQTLRLGATLKYLVGHAGFRTEKMNIGVETTAMHQMKVNVDASILSSLPLRITRDRDGYVDGIEIDDNVKLSQLAVGNNRGWGFDLGMVWEPTEKLILGASVTDIGYIRWNEMTNRFSANSSFLFKGMDAGPEIAGSDTDRDYWEEITDSIQNTFNVSDNNVKYKTGLHGSVNLIADLKVKKWLSIGAVSRHYMIDGTWLPNFQTSAGLHAGKVLSAVVTYGITRNHFSGIGAGLMLKGGPIQFYVASDNIEAIWMPQNAKYANVRTGINIVW